MSVFALAASLAVGSFTIATDAFARGPGGHVSRSSIGSVRSISPGPRFSAAPRFSASPRLSPGPRFAVGPRFGVNRNFAFRHRYPYRYGYRGYPFYGSYAYLGYNGCYRWRQVWTAYGPQLVRVNVCGYPYAYRAPFIY